MWHQSICLCLSVFILQFWRGTLHQRNDALTCTWLCFEWGRVVQGHQPYFLLQSHLGPVARYSSRQLEMAHYAMGAPGPFSLRPFQVLTLSEIHPFNDMTVEDRKIVIMSCQDKYPWLLQMILALHGFKVFPLPITLNPHPSLLILTSLPDPPTRTVGIAIMMVSSTLLKSWLI